LQSGNKVTFSFTIKNTGNRTGGDVAQIYVKPIASLLPRPEKELKDFKKIFLKPGQSKKVTFMLDKNAFMYYNDIINSWVLDKSNYEILIGSSSRDIKLTGKIEL